MRDIGHSENLAIILQILPTQNAKNKLYTLGPSGSNPKLSSAIFLENLALVQTPLYNSLSSAKTYNQIIMWKQYVFVTPLQVLCLKGDINL